MMTVVFSLPEYFAPALINNDYSYLTDEEVSTLVRWLRDGEAIVGHKLTCVEADFDSKRFAYYSFRDDQYKQGTDVIDYTFTY